MGSYPIDEVRILCPQPKKKGYMPMNYKICMSRECKNCKYEINCFKEQKNEHSNNKHRKIKTGRIQPKKRPSTRGIRMEKNSKKH